MPCNSSGLRRIKISFVWRNKNVPQAPHCKQWSNVIIKIISYSSFVVDGALLVVCMYVVTETFFACNYSVFLHPILPYLDLSIKMFDWESVISKLNVSSTHVFPPPHLFLYCFTSPLWVSLPQKESQLRGPNNGSRGNIRSIQLEHSTALCSWHVEIVISSKWLMAVIHDAVWVQMMRDCCGNNAALSLPCLVLTGWNAWNKHTCVCMCVRCQELCRVACNGEVLNRAGGWALCLKTREKPWVMASLLCYVMF